MTIIAIIVIKKTKTKSNKSNSRSKRKTRVGNIEEVIIEDEAVEVAKITMAGGIILNKMLNGINNKI